MKKAFLFDLDGTLTDSGEGIINCAIVALQHFSLPVPSREEMRVFVGPPLHETFLQFGVKPEQVDEAIRVYRERYIPIGKFENTPYPGVEAVLQNLKKAGHKLYVATSKPEKTSVEILEHFDLAKYFDRICGASMDLSRNSKEAVIAYLLEENGKENPMVMIGDTKFDVLGAKKHGIPTVGVSWGYGQVEDMVESGAVKIVDTMDALQEYLLNCEGESL